MDKKLLSGTVSEAIDRENLTKRDAARYLNMHPSYLSMINNEKTWDGIPQKAWVRFEEWMKTRERIQDFVIPEGEEIFEFKPKATKEKQAEKLKEEFTGVSGRNQMSEFLQAVTGSDIKKPEQKMLPEKNRAQKPVKIKPNGFPVLMEPTRLKVALDIEINLVINGQRVLISN